MLDHRTQRTDVTDDDWILAERADAPVTLVEYADFECPHCGKAAPEIEAVLSANPELVRLVYRSFPLQSIHPNAVIAAEAAEAAGAQGLFWEMHAMLFGHQGALDYDSLAWYARAIGLDFSRFDREMSSHVYLDDVRRDFRMGIRDGVNGTPTLFINGLRYDGPRDRMALRAAIANRLAQQHPDQGMHVL
jgi:protein-disulfide isomerase